MEAKLANKMNKSVCKLIFLILLGCITIFDCSVEKKIQTNKETKQKIDDYIQDVMKKFDIPGIAIAVTKDSESIYINTFGVKNVVTKEKLQPEHIFHMASVSKPFVATAIVQLIEQGKINLDEPLTAYLPYFRLDDERYKDITIRQMLNHTSGMPDVNDYEWDKPQYDEGAAERYVRSLKKEKLIAAPGERYQYSNMAYNVLGDVIAKVSGKPFEDYMKDSILNPLGMKESNFLYEHTKKELRTSPHIWNSGVVVSDVYPYNRPHAPSGTLNSNVIEMIKWAEANLNHGELNGTRILNEQSCNLLWQPSVHLSERTSIGLGWVLSEHRGFSTISHSGDDLGYSSDLKLIPEKKIGIIMASNYMSTPISSLLEGTADILLGFEPEVPKKSVSLYFRRIMEKDGIEAAKDAYHKWYKESKDEYSFGPQEFNSLGYKYIRNNEMNNAMIVFLFNVELYPDNSNVYDSLAEAHMINGDIKLAIDYYKKSLELNPDNTNAIEMLKKLK
jgi:CubicO group peptidase (beta-lactamase class C family)